MDTDDDFVPPNDTGAALLRSMEDGTFINAVGNEVQAAIKSLRQTADRKGGRVVGKVTLTINLAVGKKGDLESVGAIAVKLPKSKRETSIHWVDEEGDLLSRRPERQLDLKLHETKGEAEAEAKSPPKKTATPAVKGL